MLQFVILKEVKNLAVCGQLIQGEIIRCGPVLEFGTQNETMKTNVSEQLKPMKPGLKLAVLGVSPVSSQG